MHDDSDDRPQVGAGRQDLARDVPADLQTDPLIHASSAYARQHGLSARETQVFLQFIVKGAANKEIAAALGIGYPTVKLYWSRICRKLRCENAIGAIIMFLRDSLVSCPSCGRCLAPLSET